MKKIFLGLLLIAVALNVNAQPKKRALVEHFTGASCSYCAQLTPRATPVYVRYADQISVVSYHMFLNQITDDPMYVQNPQTMSQTKYYGVTGLPSVYVDGKFIGTSSLTSSQIENAINAANNKSTPFDMNLSVKYNQNMDSVFFTLTITPDRDTTFTSFVRVTIHMIEKEINFATAPGTNGEKEFSNVKRLAIPREDNVAPFHYGDTTVQKNWVRNTPVVLTYAAKVPTYIYHKDQLDYVAYIQTTKDKNVLQSTVPQNAGVVTQEAVTDEVYCGLSSFIPKSLVKNGLDTAITSLQFQYALNGGTIQNYAWNGRIESGKELQITLPEIASGWNIGSNSLFVSFLSSADKRYTSGSKDTVPFICVDDTDNPTMPKEEFSTAFPPAGWYVAPNINNIWTRANTSTVNGYAAKAAFFGNTSIGKIETLYLPKQLMPDTPVLQFDYAYLAGPNYDDGIRISASDDCGENWTVLYEAYGFEMHTGGNAIPVFSFTPSAANQWKSKNVYIDKKFAGKQVFLKIEAIIDGGNNFYIDNMQLKNQILHSSIKITTDPARGVVYYNEGGGGNDGRKTYTLGDIANVVAKPVILYDETIDDNVICSQFEYWYKEHDVQTGDFSAPVSEKEEVILSYDYSYSFIVRDAATLIAKFSRLSECVIATNTKKIEVKAPADIKHISNPVHNIVTIDGGERMIEQVEIYNMMGTKLINKKLNVNIAEINVQLLEAGMYIVRIYTDKGLVDKKIIKQ